MACVVSVALAGMAAARDITLGWDASPSEGVVRYVVSMGANDGGPYPKQWMVDGRLNTQLVVPDLGPGRYFFIAQAVNTSNVWSDFSNQVEVMIPESPQLSIVETPSLLLTGVVYRATNVLGPWEEFVRLPVVAMPLMDDLGFFRLGLEWGP